jgi:long-chain fatty acid transport protein
MIAPLHRRRALALPLLLLALCVPTPAHASPLIELIGSVGGNGGMQGVVSGPGAASTYFNPALLNDADEDILFAYALVSEQVGVTLYGRTGGDVPLSVGQRTITTPSGTPIPNDVVPTQWLAKGCPAGTQAGQCAPPGFAARPRQAQGTSGTNRSYGALGLVKHIVPDRLSLGFYALVPLSSLTTAQSFYPDEREALFSNSLHPELYGDRLTAISFVLGLAFKILPQISIGASLSLGLANAASTNTYVRDATNYSTLLLDNTITTQVDLAPTIGLSYKPVRWLRFGGTLHSPEKFTVDTTIDATLPSGTTSGATLDNVFDWMPWSVDFGTEADVIERGQYTMSLTASLKYAFWSAYVDRVGQSPSAYGPGLGWSDTLSATVGVRHKYGDVRGFIDMGYVPSPVPEQVGRSNYVDNDRVLLAAGGDIVLHIGRAKIRPGAQFFVNRLIRRDNVKDDALITDELPDGSVFSTTGKAVPGAVGLQTNNPGWPGFASEGWVWGGGITVEVPL